MAEIPSSEDQAVRYVLGELSPAERRQFEVLLEKSEELRALVRELEAGTVAAALALPQREPPGQTWSEIEKAIATDREVAAPALWQTFRMQSGWWAAAACLLGWLFYALWVNRAQSPAKPSPVVSENHSVSETAALDSSRTEPPGAVLLPTAATNAINSRPRVSPLARTGEIAALRRQIQDLETQVAQMSQVLTQQHALPAESSQFTFLQLVPSNTAGGRIVSPSPDLQRALFFAMARELGWLRSQEAAARAGGAEPGAGTFDSATATDSDVDFVYLTPPGGDSQPHTADSNEPAGSTNLVAQGGTSTSDEGSLVSSAIPMFTSGSNVFMAIDSSIVPVGSSLAFWNGTQLIGAAVLGGGPMVVSFASPNSAANGFGFTVTSGIGNPTNGSLFMSPGPVIHKPD